MIEAALSGNLTQGAESSAAPTQLLEPRDEATIVCLALLFDFFLQGLCLLKYLITLRFFGGKAFIIFGFGHSLSDLKNLS